MVELTGRTSYYAVEIGDVIYTAIEQHDTNPDYVTWEVLRVDDENITEKESDDVLEMVKKYLQEEK